HLQRFGEAEQRRRVEDNQVEFFASAVEKSRQRAAYKIGGAAGGRASRHDLEIQIRAWLEEDLAPVDAMFEHLRKSRHIFHTEELVKAGTPHVAIDEQRFVTLLGMRDREMRRHGGFSFGG